MRRRFLSRKIDNNYLTFEILGDNAMITFSGGCEYCIDGDGYWRQLTADGSSTLVNKGQTVSFRANLIPNSDYGIGRFTCTQRINIHGNCMSMLYGDTAAGKYSLAGYPYAFKLLFSNCLVENVDEDILPATTLSRGCYESMFQGCVLLKSAPKLPATALEEYCYANMFESCSSITVMPELPATVLYEGCYSSMFAYCTSLSSATILPATTLANYCYGGMFYGCTSLTTAPELPATTLNEYSCYENMFEGCSNLNYVKADFLSTPGEDYTFHWLYGVASRGTFVKNKDATWDVTGPNGVPEGWSVVYDGQQSGGINFPVTLVEGDNGQVGIDLFNFLQNNVVEDEYDGYYPLSTDEVVTFTAFGMTETITQFTRYSSEDDIWRTSLNTFGNSTLILSSDGYVSVNWA